MRSREDAKVAGRRATGLNRATGGRSGPLAQFTGRAVTKREVQSKKLTAAEVFVLRHRLPEIVGSLANRDSRWLTQLRASSERSRESPSTPLQSVRSLLDGVRAHRTAKIGSRGLRFLGRPDA